MNSQALYTTNRPTWIFVSVYKKENPRTQYWKTLSRLDSQTKLSDSVSTDSVQWLEQQSLIRAIKKAAINSFFMEIKYTGSIVSMRLNAMEIESLWQSWIAIFQRRDRDNDADDDDEK